MALEREGTLDSMMQNGLISFHFFLMANDGTHDTGTGT
jgi:hypothetical protein